MTGVPLRLVIIVIGVAAVWVLAAGLPWPARAWLAALLIVLPDLVLAQARLARALPDELPRPAAYASSAAALWLLAAVTLVAAHASGFTPRMLGLTGLPAGLFVGWTVLALAALGLVLAAGRALRVKETPILRQLLPRTRGERWGFAALSVSAGVAEELVFRGFMIPALGFLLPSVWFAALISSAAFGVVHAYQGAAGVVRATVLGFLLAVPFLVSGSLVPSMAAHAAFNIISGIWLADWLLRR